MKHVCIAAVVICVASLNNMSGYATKELCDMWHERFSSKKRHSLFPQIPREIASLQLAATVLVFSIFRRVFYAGLLKVRCRVK